MEQCRDALAWDDLRLFLTSATLGSFSAAARHLGMEQSTVSRRIARLEQQLGATLFMRGRGGLLLTEQGERILPLADEARLRIEELAETARPSIEGTVRIALTESMAVFGLIDELPTLLDTYPTLRIRLVVSNEVSDLSRREADIALRFVRPTHTNLVFRQLTSLKLSVWGTTRWLETPLDQLPWVHLAMDDLPTPETDWIRQHSQKPPRLSSNGYLSVVAALRLGIGVSVIADVLGEQTDELVQIPLEIPMPADMPLYLVGHASSRRTPRIAVVWRFLEDWAKRWSISK